MEIQQFLLGRDHTELTKTKQKQKRNWTETIQKQNRNRSETTNHTDSTKRKIFSRCFSCIFLIHNYSTASVKWIHHVALQGIWRRWGRVHVCGWRHIPRNISTKLKNKRRFCGWGQHRIKKCMKVMNYWWICEMMLLDLVENYDRLPRFF